MLVLLPIGVTIVLVQHPCGASSDRIIVGQCYRYIGATDVRR